MLIRGTDGYVVGRSHRVHFGRIYAKRKMTPQHRPGSVGAMATARRILGTVNPCQDVPLPPDDILSNAS